MIGLGLMAIVGVACQEASDDQKEALPVSCEDMDNLRPSDLNLRQTYGYVEVTPVQDQLCSNCNLYLPYSHLKACGSCLLFKGPVKEGAYCTSWTPQVEG